MIQSQYSSRVIKLLSFLLVIALILFSIFYFINDSSEAGHVSFKTHYGFAGGATVIFCLFVFSFVITMNMVKGVSISEKEIIVTNLIGSKKRFYKHNTVCVLAHTKRAFMGSTEYIVLQEGELSAKIFEFAYSNFDKIKEQLDIDVEGKKRA